MDQHISEERLMAFIDNQAGEEEMAQIKDHLADCSQCSAYVEEMRLLFSDLEQLSPPPETPNLKEDTLQLLRIARQQPRLFESRFGLQQVRASYRLITAGAIAAGLAIGVLFGNFALSSLDQADSTEKLSSVVLQKNDTTINDTYIAMIINEGQDF